MAKKAKIAKGLCSKIPSPHLLGFGRVMSAGACPRRALGTWGRGCAPSLGSPPRVLPEDRDQTYRTIIPPGGGPSLKKGSQDLTVFFREPSGGEEGGWSQIRGLEHVMVG